MKLQIIFAAMILLAPIMADSHEKSAGITPDSILWGLDVALDKISLALTRNPEKRAEKALEIAQERLMEVKAMAEAGKFDALAKAESEHESTIFQVEESVDDITDDDPEVQIEKELELESKLKKHRESVERVKTELKVKIQIEGKLTDEQQTRLDEFLASLTENTENVRIKIKDKKDGTKIKIKVKTGKTEREIEEDIERLEIEHGLLEEKIKVRGKVYGNKTYVKIELEYESNKTVLNKVLAEFLEKFYLDTNKADALLEMRNGDEEGKDSFRVKIELEDDGSEIDARLRFVVNFTERNQVVDAIVERTNLELSDIGDALLVKEKRGERSDEIEIEVKTFRSTARVKIKIGKEKTRLELDTVNHTEILSAIAAQLGLSVEEIKGFTKFEDEDGNEVEDEDEINDIENDEDKSDDDNEDSASDSEENKEDESNDDRDHASDSDNSTNEDGNSSSDDSETNNTSSEDNSSDDSENTNATSDNL